GQHGSHVHHSTGMRRPPVIDEGSSTTKPIRKDAIGLSYHVMNGVVLKVQKCPRREAGAFPMQASTPLASLPSDRESTAGDTDVLSGHDRVAVLVEHRQTVLVELELVVDGVRAEERRERRNGALVAVR